jgi:hypothetical protein
MSHIFLLDPVIDVTPFRSGNLSISIMKRLTKTFLRSY